jgi:transcriptional regulator with XRE-family HTH domain
MVVKQSTLKGVENMNVGQRIKRRRKELKISADELAKALGKDRSTIFRYEKGDIEKLPLDILEPIAKVLQTTPRYLMGWTEEAEKPIAKVDELSENMKKLIDFAKSVPDDKVELVLKVMKSIVEAD